MQLNEIRKGLEGVVFERIRQDEDSFFEAVVVQDELVKLTGVLEKFFGSAVSPSENKLPQEIEDAINSFGGIFSGQSLYFSNQEEDALLAMLWPWQDGQHTTVKLFKINKL